MDSTACGTAFFRASENLMDESVRIVSDEYAQYLLPYKYRLFLHCMRNKRFYNKMMELRQKMTPGIYGNIICRTRYIDDCIIQNVNNGIKSIVNLGAGLDTRPVRLNFLRDVPYYEIDQTDVIVYKQKTIEKNNLLHLYNTYYISMDFETSNLRKALSDAGYNFIGPTLFIMEGVTQYISKEAFQDNLSMITSAPKGSVFVFSYVPTETFSQFERNSSDHLLLRQFKKAGIRRLTSYLTSEIDNILTRFRFSVIENIGSAEYHTRYLAPITRKLEIAPLERIVYAKLQ